MKDALGVVKSAGRAILAAEDAMAKKPRIGRPPKKPGEKVVRMFVYVEPDVAARLEELARAEGDASATAYAARALTKLARSASA